MQRQTSAIIAGATGLVGNELLHILLGSDLINRVYALTRSALPYRSKHLVQIVHPELRITEWEETDPVPELGFICLGTTKKKAGGKAGLKAVDVELVKSVARSMQQLGVKHLIVISSLGASPYSPSFYLRCKAEMEQALSEFGFSHCVFVRPGPLTGEREQPRQDEILTQKVLEVLQPLLIGPLSQLSPIPAEDVARAMFNAGLQAPDTAPSAIQIIKSNALRHPPFHGEQPQA
ncbi:NAD(P)H-binding protein [Photobacterium galatheae]|uniref:NAD(P)H-binding protein n=1 Tax=Photobacterium galatheae TaxID=1654360 RepID=UPI00202CAAB2|nr:NAD(P)H-binding protein [Photobacterium galatheae]MCM0147512.1 NAD(P)H-binding protein [Photobacterium galatheae]